jgi:hypothetical protein
MNPINYAFIDNLTTFIENCSVRTNKTASLSKIIFMKGVSIYIIFGLFTFVQLNAQNSRSSIAGTLVDKETSETLAGAHIQLKRISDSSTVDLITDENGLFKAENLRPGKYTLKASYIGFTEFHKEIDVRGITDLGKLFLETESLEIEGVEVKGKALLASQKGDTTQFNAAAFKTNPDASAEDLIKKMPGVSVENGQVQAQGEQIREVLVNGKPFFGNDPRAALQNLPAELIEQIQVFDRQNDQAQFTGFNSGETTKTINIITKGNMTNGSFGRFFGGIGSEGTYKVGGNYNIFNGDRKFTILGMSNNINQQNFSNEDLSGLMSGSGGNRGGMGGGGNWRGRGGAAGEFMIAQQNGIAKTNALGINYSDKWFNKIDVSSSYFFNTSTNDALSNLTRQFVDSRNEVNPVYKETAASQTNNTNHRFQARIDYKITDKTSILITPRLTYQGNDGFSNTLGLNLLGSFLANQSDYDFNSDLKNIDFSNEILFRQKFNKDGRTLSIGFNQGFRNNDGESNLLSEIIDPKGINTIDQISRLESGAWNIGSNITYTEPLGKKTMFQLSYRMNTSLDDSDKKTYNYSIINEDYTDLNTYLSNVFTSNYTFHRTGGSFRMNGEKYNFNIDVEGQLASLNNSQTYPFEDDVKRNFINVLPSFSYTYNFNRSNNLRINYRTSTNPPSLGQLQEVIDNSNPLRLVTGNPDLQQQYDHRLFARYSRSNTEKSTFLFAMIRASYTDNFIANKTFLAIEDIRLNDGVLLQRGGQLVSPINMTQGNWNVRTFVTYGMPLGILKSNLNINSSIDYSNRPGIINDLVNFAKTTGVSLGANLTSNISEKLDFNLGSRINLNNVRNTVSTNLNNNYYIQTNSLGFNWIFGKGFVFRTDVNHNSFKGLDADFNQDFLLVNASFGKKFLKNQQGELRLEVFDLLKQNNSIARNVTEVFFEDVQNMVLQQYFMVTFTYNLRKFNLQNQNNRGRF